METRVLTKGQKDKYEMTIGSSVVSGSIRDELKKEIRKVLKENGYSNIQDGVDAAADYILMEDEYYSPSLSELPSVAEKWFRETKENFPEILIKASKTIKSTFGGNAVFEIMDDKLMNARRNIRSCISINPKKELDNELQHIDELIGDALTHTEMVKNGDYDDYMSPVNNSHKSIKSSLEDRLIPYLEEFEEGYADTINRDAEEGVAGVYNEAFLEGFKNDYNLTDEDIEKLKEAVHNIWNESAEDEIRDMGEMYGVPRGATSEEALKHFE